MKLGLNDEYDIPTEADDSVKEYLRMRNDHKIALKNIKQQINAFCIRHGFCYDGTKWTLAHLKWLKKLEITNQLYRETLDEYMASYEEQEVKIERYDKRIEEIAEQTKYHDKFKKLECFLGIKTHTALSLVVETGDFERFAISWACSGRKLKFRQYTPAWNNKSRKQSFGSNSSSLLVRDWMIC